jgi:hypothetical protein
MRGQLVPSLPRDQAPGQELAHGTHAPRSETQRERAAAGEKAFFAGELLAKSRLLACGRGLDHTRGREQGEEEQFHAA